MWGAQDWLEQYFGLATLDNETVPEAGRIDRAIFWPCFGPYVTITVRDFGDVGEVELVAFGIGERLPRGSDVPERWVEAQMVGSLVLESFRHDMAEAQPESLDDVELNYFVRDGIWCEGEVRLRDLHRRFRVENHHDFWQDQPRYERFFRTIWRLARQVLSADWSRQILSPASYSYGDLLANEVVLENRRAPTKWQRS